MRIDKSLDDTMFWEPVTIETAQEGFAVLVATADLHHMLASAEGNGKIVYIAMLESRIERAEGALPGLQMNFPKSVGFEKLVEFYAFKFATISLAHAKFGA